MCCVLCRPTIYARPVVKIDDPEDHWCQDELLLVSILLSHLISGPFATAHTRMTWCIDYLLQSSLGWCFRSRLERLGRLDAIDVIRSVYLFALICRAESESMAKASLELFRFALVSQVPLWSALEITAFALILHSENFRCTFISLWFWVAGLNLLHHRPLLSMKIYSKVVMSFHFVVADLFTLWQIQLYSLSKKLNWWHSIPSFHFSCCIMYGICFQLQIKWLPPLHGDKKSQG